MKTTKLTHWAFSNFRMYPISNIFPSDCQFLVMKLHFIGEYSDRFTKHPNVSMTIAEAADFLTQGTDQIPAFVELAQVVKRHDKHEKINWVETGKVVEYILEQKQYTAAFIAATLDRLYSAVGVTEASIQA